MNEEKDLNDLEEGASTNLENQENQQTTKTYSEDELNQRLEEMRNQINEDNQKAWNKRWGREKSKMERANAEKDELIELLKKQTNSNSVEDLLDLSYKQYNVDRPNKQLTRDEEILGKYDAKEILELDEQDIADEYEKLANKKKTAREESTFKELDKFLKENANKRKLEKEIKENGIDEKLLSDDDFMAFKNKFNSDTPIKEIVDLYGSRQATAKKTKPFSAGSLADRNSNQKLNSEYFTEEELNSLTRKDLQNPEIMKKARKSYQKLLNS